MDPDCLFALSIRDGAAGARTFRCLLAVTGHSKRLKLCRLRDCSGRAARWLLEGCVLIDQTNGEELGVNPRILTGTCESGRLGSLAIAQLLRGFLGGDELVSLYLFVFFNHSLSHFSVLVRYS